jgi:putative tricarboxylic transport membrane protein
MLELRVKQSMSLSQGDATIFLTRPLAATFLAFAIIAVGIFTWQHLKHDKPKSQTAGPS